MSPTVPPRIPRRPDRSGSEAGFALVAALWILVLVGALSAGFLAAAEHERRTVAHALETARARWAARAGLARVSAALDGRLASTGAVASLRSAGDTLLRTDSFRINDVSVEAALLDSRARLDLNRASRRELVTLLTAAGVDPARAERLTAAVLDWRDPDGAPRAAGAEAPRYAALGLPARPRNGPLASLRELQRVRGWGGELGARMRSYLTVVGDSRINVNSAPVPVLAALPVLDRAAARLLADRRDDEGYESAFDVVRALPDDIGRRLRRRLEAFEKRAAFGPRYGEISVRAVSPRGSVSFELRVAVELQGGDDWRRLRMRGP